MKLISTKDLPFRSDVGAIVVPVTEAAAKKLPQELKELDRALDGLLASCFALQDFKGEEHTTAMLLTNGALPAPRLLLVGAGKQKDKTRLEWQHIVGTAARVLQGVKVMRWALALPADLKRGMKPEVLGALTAKGVIVSTYHFADYKSDEKAKLPATEEVIVGPLTAAEARKFAAGVAEGTIVGDAMNWMRRFGDMPSSDATPTFLAEQARALAKTDKRFSITVLDRAALEKEKMGALLGVARGAHTPPVCIVLEWNGVPARRRGGAALRPSVASREGGSPPVRDWYALVGKGITFDSGGISIKPGDKMDEMKFDMSGGAAVLGAMKAIAGLQLKANIVGIVPATDNLPSGTAYKPGDILKTCRGKTIEVLNTDAEGRIVLADGIGYAMRYEPKAIVDLATLTGACVVALGSHYAGLFANDEKLRKQVSAASDASGDRAWPLPLGDAYTRDIKSDIADIQNLGKHGREAGAITAAAFLQECAEGKPWAHLDIAGTAWGDATAWRAKGATGYGVHLLVELVKGWAK